MDNFSYCTPTYYQFGSNAETMVGKLTKNIGASKVMIVFGQNHAKASGLLDRIEASLSEFGIEYIELGGVKPNPIDTLVYEGIIIGRNEKIDALIAVGGGSVIDTAKAIAAGIPYEGDFWDFFIGKTTIEHALPIGTVLTVPGAGSEGSGNCVITHTTDGVAIKLSLRTDKVLRPCFSILNPELTYTLSLYQTAVGIVDMMSHIMERYFTTTTDVEVTDRIAEGLLLALITESQNVMKTPTDYNTRANIMWAGTMAHNGIAGCGRREDWVSHFMEHEISALYPQVAHGAGLAIVFPAWMTFMAKRKPVKVAQLGRRVFNIDDIDDLSAAIETVAALRRFFSDTLKMPTNFAELGIVNPDIDTMVTRLHINKGEKIGGYYTLSSDDTRLIYRLMLADDSK